VLFGAITAWGCFLDGGPVVKEFIHAMNYSLANGYVVTFLTTFIAAVSAALVIAILDWWRGQNRLLAEINEAKTILYGYVENLIQLKSKHAVPQYNFLLKIKDSYERTGVIQEIRLPQYGGEAIKFSASIPYGQIAKYANFDSECLRFLIKSSEAVNMVISLIDLRNEEIRKAMANENDEQRLSLCLGTEDARGIINTIIPDLTLNVVKAIDWALYFIQESLDHVDNVVNKALFLGLRDRIIDLGPLNNDAKKWMPDAEKIRKEYLGANN